MRRCDSLGAMTGALEQGRQSFEQQAWGKAFAQLSAADVETTLEPDDLERLAMAAYLTGRDQDCEEVLLRAHHAWLDRVDVPGACRCAFWLGFELTSKGEFAQGGGWFARAQRLLDEGHHDCVERGYLLVPLALQSHCRG